MNLGGLFATACDFARASYMIKDSETLLVPYVVNGAFACELYLKGLLMLQGKTLQDIKKHHSLSQLYALLDDGTKENLKSSVMRKFTNSNKAFEAYLDDIANAFVEWRYGYENQEVRVDSGENGVINISITLSGNGIYKEFLEILMSCLHDLTKMSISQT